MTFGGPAPLYPTERGLSSFICGNAAKSSENRVVPATGSKIGENLGKLGQIMLDIATPRAAPRNSTV